MSRRAHYGVVALLLLVLVSRAMFAAVPDPIGTVHLSTGWATFGQAVPEGSAYDGLQVGSLTTQTDVKNRWPGGSIKFAILTVQVPAENNYAIYPAPSELGDFTPIPRNVSVDMSINGTPHSAVAPSAPGDYWLKGPLVQETRHVVAPNAGGIPHPFLRINFDVRSYNDGSGRADVSVENMLDQIGASTVTYDATIWVDNPVQPSFSRLGIEHFYLTRWRHTKTIGPSGAMSAIITPDIASLNTTKALPPYLPLVAAVVNDMGPTFDILREGALTRYMPAHSGRPELAPYPDWAARYLVHKDIDQKRFVLANGDLSGSWPIHVREPEDGTSAHAGVGAENLVSLNLRPWLWLDDRAENLASCCGIDFVRGTPMPLGTGTENPVPGSGQSPLNPDNAHQPSIAYVPYLLTGDRYYAEEMAFWANYGMMKTSPENGVRGADGILGNDNETRGVAWALRNLVDAAAYYPDASPVRNYLRDKVTANLQWLDDYVHNQPATNPLKIPWIGFRPEPGMVAMWEMNYVAWAIDRASKQGFEGGLAHRDVIAKLQLDLFRNTPAYPRTSTLTNTLDFSQINGEVYPVGSQIPWGAPFTLQVAEFTGDPNDPDSWWAHNTPFTTLEQIRDATQGDPFNHRPYAGYYGPEARLNLMIGVEEGWPGAEDAHDYLFQFIGIDVAACGNLGNGDDRPDLACRAGWALDFYLAAPGGGEADGDGDGVFDAADNCPAVANPDQANHDPDAQGDACDDNDDNDSFDDAAEIAAGSDPLNAASTPEVCDTIDNDLDGLNNEGFPNTDGTDDADCIDTDDDNDGHSDVAEGLAGSDPLNAASTPEVCDAVDNDLDGLNNEGFPNNDNDDDADCVDDDDDNDGVPDADDPFPFDNTPPGDDVTVDTPQADITFDTITDPGTTLVTPTQVDPGSVPAGFSIAGLPAFNVTTTAKFSGPIVLCFNVSSLSLAEPQFALLRVLHGEGGVFVDRTVLPNDFATQKVCARVMELSPFVIASVVAVNGAPSVDPIAQQTSQEDMAIAPLVITGSDPDGDTLTFTVTGLPQGLTWTPGNNNITIAGTPTQADDVNVEVTVSDGTDSATTSFLWIVTAAPSQISLTNPDSQSNTEGEKVRLELQWSAPGSGNKHFKRPTFRAENLPRGLHIGRHDGVISGHVSRRGERGPEEVTVTMRLRGEEVSQTFLWTILPKNHAPRIKHLNDQESKVGQDLELKLSAFDQDGDRLEFHVVTLPPGLEFDPAGLIFGTPTGKGHYRAVVTVSDGHATDTCDFEWTIKAPKDDKPKK